MEVAPTSTHPLSTTTAPKSPDPDTGTPTRIEPTTKPKSFTNGVLKRHRHNHHQAPPIVVIYKECLKNHAATLGGHALDGCGEFLPSPTATPTDPTSLKCAVCGCHRNFHRREPEDPPPMTTATATIEYQPHHRHHPPPPATQQPPHHSPNSASPPPISSSYYPSAPHMLLALSGGFNTNPGSNSKKRFRTKFSQFQKEKMLEFAERFEWKIQKRDEEAIQEFCKQVGVDRGVLKVWMHNNKSTFGKKGQAINGGESANNNYIDSGISHDNDDDNINNNNDQNLNHHFESVHLGTNGSSSS
ncbi:Zinc-finger homeodomain protein 9 [Hibiscus syriacus]|uniref:Zinc-finger homeodomain protein 9 n=1 Tax=Hibiscus syriacus TaxID=106335 RepID=A0A6A2Y4C0_HIBSY|nr:zinc-finger homeodomain protein 10-like [Hibiscus syriacus]KAE8675665.1 Zinc-finger homeodomain protein 9 [Hibiscus syriacus]